MKGFQRRIGHAPINFTNLDLIFEPDVVYAVMDALSFGPFFYIFISGSNDPKKTKATKTCSEKQDKTIGPTLDPFERAVQRRVENSRSKLAKLSGASQ